MVDPMNGRICLEIIRIMKTKVPVIRMDVVLEERERKLKQKAKEKESEIDLIPNIEFPNFDGQSEKEQ